MPTPKLAKITAWSHSRFSTYSQCPFKAKCQIVDRLKEPDSAAGVRGTEVHELAAQWAENRLKKMPAELATFEGEFKELRKIKLFTEADWAFDSDWNKTDWFGPRAWLRMKVDLHYLEVKKNGVLRETTVHVRDHKTGRVHEEEHALQRSLYALGALLMYPDAKRATVAHWYLDQGVEHKQVWEAAVLNELKREWLKRTQAMLSDTTFTPRPGMYCKWCYFRKANSGPCRF